MCRGCLRWSKHAHATQNESKAQKVLKWWYCVSVTGNQVQTVSGTCGTRVIALWLLLWETGGFLWQCSVFWRQHIFSIRTHIRWLTALCKLKAKEAKYVSGDDEKHLKISFWLFLQKCPFDKDRTSMNYTSKYNDSYSLHTICGQLICGYVFILYILELLMTKIIISYLKRLLIDFGNNMYLLNI